MAEATVIVNVRVPLQVRKRLEKAAVRHNLSLNRLVIGLLEQALADGYAASEDSQ